MNAKGNLPEFQNPPIHEVVIGIHTDNFCAQETNTPEPDFIEFFRKIMEYRNLPNNWDSYGATAPNEWAISKANDIFDVLQEYGLVPSDVLPSAENGIGIIFRRGDRYADIECLNHGHILAVKSDGKGEPHAWEVSISGPNGIRDALRQIKRYLETTAS